MGDLTALGWFHTAVSLCALIAGIWLLVRDKQMDLNNRLTQFYVVTTAIVALTALGIFRHGGFSPAHGLAILTILALSLGIVANLSSLFGKFTPYLQALGFSTTMLCHLIPGVTETLTRLPLGAPLFASVEAPEFKVIYGVLLACYVVGLALQMRWLYRRGH